MCDTEHGYVGVSDWLGDPPEPLERGDGLALLARRYLAGHGPADARDLARWAGLPLGEARLGLDRIAAELVQRPGGLVDLSDRPAAAELPPPRLLGAFDPLLLGWVSRQPFVGDHATVVTTNGVFRPFALVEGRVVATWGLRGARLTVRLLEPVTTSVIDVLREDAADVLRFLGLPDGTSIAFVP
jgi:hypothetical protein